MLNFFRYGIYALADGLIEGAFVEETVYALIVQDILQFAGLALMATGFFRRLRLKEGQILLVGVLLSALGGPLAFVYQSSPVADYFLGHFVVTTEQSSCFAFFNWCILGFVDSIFCYLLGLVFPWSVIYLFGVTLTVLSAWLAQWRTDRKRENHNKKAKKLTA